MNLSFDNLDELDRFLRWADLYRSPSKSEPATAQEAAAIGRSLQKLIGAAAETAQCASAAVDGDPFPTIDAASLPARSAAEIEAEGRRQFAAAQQVAEPAKRKRRTKAEIEADEKAAADAAGADLKAASDAGAAEPAASEAPPAGANPFDQPSTLQDVGAAGPAAGAEGGESDVVTPFQHLTRAREFIAKHGMPKYNESFAKAGLDANVMGYTAYQRGVHMAALDELEKG
jgi:hypothetical protein